MATESSELNKQRALNEEGEIRARPEAKNEEAEEDVGIPREIMESLPPEVRSQVRKSMSLSMMAGQFAAPHPLLSKVTPQHIDKMLDYTESDNVRQQQDRAANRK